MRTILVDYFRLSFFTRFNELVIRQLADAKDVLAVGEKVRLITNSSAGASAIVESVKQEHLQSIFEDGRIALYELGDMGFSAEDECVDCLAAYQYAPCYERSKKCEFLAKVESRFAKAWDDALTEEEKENYSYDKNPLVAVVKLKEAQHDR